MCHQCILISKIYACQRVPINIPFYIGRMQKSGTPGADILKISGRSQRRSLTVIDISCLNLSFVKLSSSRWRFTHHILKGKFDIAIIKCVHYRVSDPIHINAPHGDMEGCRRELDCICTRMHH